MSTTTQDDAAAAMTVAAMVNDNSYNEQVGAPTLPPMPQPVPVNNNNNQQQPQAINEEGYATIQGSVTSTANGVVITGQHNIHQAPPPHYDPSLQQESSVTNTNTKKRTKKKCNYITNESTNETCHNIALKDGVCKRHGAKFAPKAICGYEGCTNQGKFISSFMNCVT